MSYHCVLWHRMLPKVKRLGVKIEVNISNVRGMTMINLDTSLSVLSWVRSLVVWPFSSPPIL